MRSIQVSWDDHGYPVLRGYLDRGRAGIWASWDGPGMAVVIHTVLLVYLPTMHHMLKSGLHVHLDILGIEWTMSRCL